MSEYENLKAAMDEWREGVKVTLAETSKVSTKNPYGQELYDLNMEWAELRRANDAKIRAEQERYDKKREELMQASAAWKKEYGPWTAGRGRAKNPDYSDEVKIAAVRLLQAGNRTQVRSVMAIQDTATLNRVLDEGKALLEAKNKTEEDEW